MINKKILAPILIISSPFIYNYARKNKKIDETNILKNDASGKTVLSVSKMVSKNWDNDSNNINVYENEKKWLEKLKNSDIIAKPIHFDDKSRIITTEYSGENINKYNLPKNWEDQRDHIIETLRNNNCRHNDIKPNEILVYNGKLKLVDFGWASNYDKQNPKSWPKCLGAEFKCNLKNKEFDDECILNKSVKYILKK